VKRSLSLAGVPGPKRGVLSNWTIHKGESYSMDGR